MNRTQAADLPLLHRGVIQAAQCYPNNVAVIYGQVTYQGFGTMRKRCGGIA